LFNCDRHESMYSRTSRSTEGLNVSDSQSRSSHRKTAVPLIFSVECLYHIHIPRAAPSDYESPRNTLGLAFYQFSSPKVQTYHLGLL